MKAETSMFNRLMQDINKAVPGLSDHARQHFMKGLECLLIKKNGLFIKAGERQRYLGYISGGFMRSFYINDSGKEVNNRFLLTGEFAVHYSAFIKNENSKYSFQCLEDTQLVCFTHDHIENCYEKFPEFERYGRLIAEDVFVKYENHLENILFNKPYERYLQFMREYPEIYQKISLTMLSSYLGIDRVSLSRIRKRIRAKHM